jgi:hypothetical protein
MAAFFLVRITNSNISRIYKNSHATTFQLLSEIADNYRRRDFELRGIEVNNLQNTGRDILKVYLKKGDVSLNENLYGVWVYRNSILKKSKIRFPETEKIILDFYAHELKGKEYGTLINLEGEPFYLVNVTERNYSILLLSRAAYGGAGGITRVLDSLVSSSNLVYFAIIDGNGSPVVYSSLYEGFLPVEGEGSHIIETPRGKIFQLEEENNGQTIVAGFSMSSLERVIVVNDLFLLLVIIGFAVFLSLLLFNLSKSERYRVVKEGEIRHLEEIGALSSGFSHEVRNSLNTLSLLARNVEGEHGDILKAEVKRMNLVMDSMKLLILSRVDKEQIDINDTINEAISLTDKKNDSVEIKLESQSNIKIVGNRSLLVSAFSNIFRNAVEADANKVKIMMRKTGNNVGILIVDNGKGIDKDKVARVFEPFYSNKRQSGKETKVGIILPVKD